MSYSSIITTIGITLIIIYGIMKILEFYGIGLNAYAIYFTFYIFLILCAFVLPRQYKKLY
jgi:hypothetical protein